MMRAGSRMLLARHFGLALSLPMLLIFLFLALPATVSADDCEKDYRRAEDCLRTPGFAQGIATVAGATVVILVNGAAIGQTILGGDRTEGQSDERDEEEEDAPRYSLEINTEEGRTRLTADNQDGIWLYGRVTCDKPEIDTSMITNGLRFFPEGVNSDWISISQPQMSGGFKAVLVQAGPPLEEAVLETGQATIMVAATIEGEEVSGPVSLELTDEDYELEVKVW